MADDIARPPFDPELAEFLVETEQDTPVALTTEMLPFARTPDLTDDQVHEALRARGLVRQDYTIPGTTVTRSSSRS